jgi:hypothetical protein
MADFTEQQYREAARRAMQSGDTAAAQELIAAGMALSQSAAQQPQSMPGDGSNPNAAQPGQSPMDLMRQSGLAGAQGSGQPSMNVMDPVQRDPTFASRAVETVMDNVIGLDNGRQSFGEKAANFLNTAGESMTLGVVGDEAAAGLDAVMGRGTYDERLEVRRGQERQFRDENPYAAFAADVAGGVAVPGTGAARFIGRGATTAARLGRSALAGAAAGGLYGAMEGEGGASERAANAASTAALGGFFGAAAPAALNAAGRGLQRLWTKAAERPSVGILQAVKNQAYKAVEDANEVFDVADMTALATRVRDIADNDVSYVPGEDTAVDAAIRSIVRREGQETTLSQLDTIRQGLWRRVTANPDQVQIYDLIGSIDDVMASRAGTSQLMATARQANRNYSQSDLIERAFQRARDQAESTGSGGNVSNLYRQAITRIINNPKQARFFDPEQIQVMRSFLSDSRSQRAMRLIGKMSPTGNGLMMMLQTLGGVATSGATVPLALAGAGAKGAADRGVMRGAERVLDSAAGFARPQQVMNPVLGATGAASAPALENLRDREAR